MRNLSSSILLFSGVLLLLLSRCQDPIDVDVPSRPPELVVDGWVTDNDSFASTVRLSTTTNFFQADRSAAVENAQVYLLENGDTVAQLQEQNDSAGYYQSPFTGTAGRSYQLRIAIPSGPEKVVGNWLSRPELLRPVPTLDSVNVRMLDQNSQPPAFTEGLFALGYFQELPGEGDYLRIRRQINDSLFQRDIFAVEDQGVDGFYFGQFPVPPIGLYGPLEAQNPENEPDTFTARLESITGDYFAFLNLLSDQVNVGSPFDAPPALVVGNIVKARDTSQYAFGYFRASATSSASAIYSP